VLDQGALLGIIAVVGIESRNVVDDKPSAWFKYPHDFGESEREVAHIGHGLNRVHRVETRVVERQRLVEIADGEVGRRQVRVSMRFFDLRRVEVDAIWRRPRALGDVFGNRATAAAEVEHFFAGSELKVSCNDSFKQNLVL